MGVLTTLAQFSMYYTIVADSKDNIKHIIIVVIILKDARLNKLLKEIFYNNSQVHSIKKAHTSRTQVWPSSLPLTWG